MSGGFQNHLYALYGLPGGFATETPAIKKDDGIYVYDKNDPKPRKRKKGKFLTLEEIEDNRRLRRQEDEELILLLVKKDFDA
jgi:hypothetical protein